MSAGMNCAFDPNDLATSIPSEEGRSHITTEAPILTKRSTVPKPRPDAPPVTSVTTFYSMRCEIILLDLKTFFIFINRFDTLNMAV